MFERVTSSNTCYYVNAGDFEPAIILDRSQFGLVSSLYGPGNTACWYLTVLSCLLSWMFSPKKRRDDSISNDFVAMLSLPVIASIHLMHQTSGFRAKRLQIDTTGDVIDFRRLQLDTTGDIVDFRRFCRSVEASLNITDNSLMIICICVLISAYNRCLRRAILLSVVGILSLVAENYLLAEVRRVDLSVGCHFYRRPLAEYIPLLWTANILVGIHTVTSIGLYICSIRDSLRHAARGNSEVESTTHQSPTFKDSNHIFWITAINLIVLLLAGVCSASPLVFFTIVDSASGLTTRPCDEFITRLRDGLFPRSGISITELDQAVALLAGLTVLAFSIYDIFSTRYQASVKRKRELQRQRHQEEIRLRHLRIPDDHHTITTSRVN